mgnify:CR=1 FL=1
MKRSYIKGIALVGLLLSFQALAGLQPGITSTDTQEVSEKERALEIHKKRVESLKRKLESKQAAERKSAKVKIEKRADKK